MKIFYPIALGITLISGCTLPDTSLWNERQTATSVRMPMEASAKVLVHGNLVSAIRNPFSSTKKGISMLRNRGSIASGIDPFIQSSVSQNATSIEQRLTQLNMPEPIAGNIDYLIDGKAFFSALETSIKDAQQTIDTRVFIFDNDDVAVRIANLIKQKSNTTRCRVMMDQLGSLSSWWTQPESKIPTEFEPPSSMPHYLRKNSKVQVCTSLNPWLVTDHAKLIIIDQKEAYLGGMNIGREYRYEWHDMMFRLKGPIVTELQNNYNKAWRLQGGLGDWGYPFLKNKTYRTTINPTEIPIRILKTDASISQIEAAAIAAIRMAKKRVYIQNSYYTSDTLAETLADAATRGVDVRMIFPEKNDSKLLDIGNLQFAEKLIAAKAKVYLYPKFTHVKALIVDDWTCIGSANFDALSMRINKEINIAFTDQKSTQQLVNKLFNPDFRKSKRLYKVDATTQQKLMKPLIEQL